MNRVSVLATFIPKTCVRNLYQSQVRSSKFDLTKLKKRQLQLQQDNDVPVYLKGGPMDYVLYFSTLALLVVGLGASVHSTYKLITKK